jgi:hypothetical protein
MGGQQATPSNYLKEQWVADEHAPCCTHCLKKFSLTRRRHHCRCCGEVFCSSCWGKTLSLPSYYEYGKSLQKVCETCHSFFAGPLRKMQQSRHVAILRYLKTQKHTPGPPLLPENFKPADAPKEPSFSRTLTLSSPGTPRSRTASSASPVASKSYCEIYSMKLAHWRPVGKETCLLFCRSQSLANEVALSARKASILNEVIVSPKFTKEDDDRDAVWNIQLETILSCVLEASLDHGLDYISVETAQEVIYMQAVEPAGANSSRGELSGLDGSCEAAFYQPLQAGTVKLCEELKVLQKLTALRVHQREELEAQGLIPDNRTASMYGMGSVARSRTGDQRSATGRGDYGPTASPTRSSTPNSTRGSFAEPYRLSS